MKRDFNVIIEKDSAGYYVATVAELRGCHTQAKSLDTLMKPEGRADLTALLSHHILPGTILAADIGKAIDAGGGKALIATMGGGTLTASRDGDKIIFADEAGTRAVVGAVDQKRSNGVIHQVDSVLMPTK